MKAIVSLSGGMDSATVLADALYRGCEVEAVGFTYGSKHNPHENAAAQNIADHYGVPFRLIDLSGAMAGFRSNLMADGGDIPEGHYEAENMRQTVVPGRNLIFAAVLTGVAWSRGAREIWLGIHAGDHYIYPDCRPTFFHAMNTAIMAGTDEKCYLVAPFLYDTKVGILRRGFELGVPYGKTRTCYTSNAVACGRCGSCQERLAAFRELGKEDPLEYETREPLPK